MSATLTPSPRSGTEPRPIGLALFALSLVCSSVIETLHGHACPGDGCILCLVATYAQVLMAMSLGITLASPLIHILSRIISRAHVSCGALWPHLEHISPAFSDARCARVEMTPVTLGVRLLI